MDVYYSYYFTHQNIEFKYCNSENIPRYMTWFHLLLDDSYLLSCLFIVVGLLNSNLTVFFFNHVFENYSVFMNDFFPCLI